MPRRVLVVDDDKYIREILAFNVRHLGLEVIEAANGMDALTKLKSAQVDLVLADIWMPEMSGLELLRWIKLNLPDLPVAVISGQPTLDTTIDALNMGAYAYLLKPVKGDQIRDVVQKGLEKVAEIESRQFATRKLEKLMELERTLRELQDSAARPAGQDVSSLIEGLRHELGNLSMAISLNLSSLQEQGNIPEELRTNMEDLHSSAEDLVALVNRLKDFDTPDRLTDHYDLREIAASALETLHPNADAKQVDLQLRYEGEPVLVACEPDSMRRALQQVIENGIEAVPPGGSVEVVVVNRELDKAALFVNDNGPGFDDAALTLVFQPEYTTKLREGFVRGLGMGLFIARAIVELHGGKITARNRPEGGASVEIQLPAHSFALS
jgi:signal transduction histidine kinase